MASEPKSDYSYEFDSEDETVDESSDNSSDYSCGSDVEETINSDSGDESALRKR